MTSEKDYNSVNWSDYFYLDASSESGIRWVTFNRSINPQTQRSAGDVAGLKRNGRMVRKATTE